MTLLALYSVNKKQIAIFTVWFGDGDFESPNSSLNKKENKMKDKIQVEKKKRLQQL